MLRRHDTYTVAHGEGVARLSADLGRALNLPAEQIWLLQQASLVHDIGEIEVPRRIVETPEQLSSLELEEMKRHATAGYEILKVIPTPWPLAEIVRQHHERLDGSGYPRKLKGSKILLEAQILAVADITESMLSWRPYRPVCPQDEVLTHLEGMRGTKLNADAVDACVHLFRDEGYRLPEYGTGAP